MKNFKENKLFTRQYILDLISSEREKIGLSVKGLEIKAGVPVDTMRDFQRGKTHILRADKLQKILNVFGYDLTITRLMAAIIAIGIMLCASPSQAVFWDKSKSDLGHATVETAFST